MKKMIKTAIVTTSLLACASVFAQVGAEANGSAQVNVQSGGLINGVTGAVKNTAQGVGHAAHHVGHAAVNTGVEATQKTVGAVKYVGSEVAQTTGTVVKGTANYAADKVADGKAFAAEKTANAKKRYQERQSKPRSLGINAQGGVDVGNVTSVQAQTGLNAGNKQVQAGANVGVKVLGVDANVGTNAKVGRN